MKNKVDVRESQWYQIGVRYALGGSRIYELPPTPNFYLGVLSVITGNPDHRLWSEPDHPFWQKLGEHVASGAIKYASLIGCQLEQLPFPQVWEGILASDPETRLLDLDAVNVAHSGRLSGSEGVREVRVRSQTSVPEIPNKYDTEKVLFA